MARRGRPRERLRSLTPVRRPFEPRSFGTDDIVSTVPNGKVQLMDLAALAAPSDPRVARAVTVWSRLTLAQRDRITLDQLAQVAGVTVRELLRSAVEAG